MGEPTQVLFGLTSMGHHRDNRVASKWETWLGRTSSVLHCGDQEDPELLGRRKGITTVSQQVSYWKELRIRSPEERGPVSQRLID